MYTKIFGGNMNLEEWENHIRYLDSQTGEDESEKFELERNILFDWKECDVRRLKEIDALRDALVYYYDKMEMDEPNDD